MDAEALRAADHLCRLVDATDLLTWLGLPRTTTADDARAALERERKRMQSMQGNPKFKEVAKHLIKNFRKLGELLGDLGPYLQHVDSAQASTQLPLLELAIDGVLADGVLTAEEEAFVREQALRLGIAIELYERVLRERCAARGVAVPDATGPSPQAPAFATVGRSTGEFRVPKNLQVAHRTAGNGWWDDAFTRLLLAAVPEESRRVIDFTCGLGWTALALLPHRPGMEYVGIDAKQLHVDVAGRNLVQAGLGGRAVFQCADPSRLPLPDGSVDVVMSVMSLQSFPDSRPLLAEAARLVRPGGRVVIVEPDCLGQQFWFDRNLLSFNEAFQALCERVDEVVRDTSGTDDEQGQPSIALGPELARRLSAAGLDPAETVIHPVQVAQRCTFPAFARRLYKRLEAMAEAAALPPDDPAVRDAEEALARLDKRHDPNVLGTGVHLMPVFLTVGYRD